MGKFIDVERRSHDWHAWIGDRTQWDCGATIEDAVAKLMETWPGEFGPAAKTILIRLHLSTQRES